MPIPALTPFGVLPVGRHECTFLEVEAAYTLNDHRSRLWADLQRFMRWTANQPQPASIYLDGSFTSDKVLPGDIDVVFDLDGCGQAVQSHWLFVFGTQRAVIKNDYRVDFWVYLPGAANDLRAFFEYVRPEEAIVRGMGPGDLKGLLRVSP